MVLTHFMVQTHFMVLVLKGRQLCSSPSCRGSAQLFFSSDSPTANLILCGHKRDANSAVWNLLLKVQMKPAVKCGALVVPAVYKQRRHCCGSGYLGDIWVTRNCENVWAHVGVSLQDTWHLMIALLHGARQLTTARADTKKRNGKMGQ